MIFPYTWRSINYLGRERKYLNCSVNIISSLLTFLDAVVEHELHMHHFSRPIKIWAIGFLLNSLFSCNVCTCLGTEVLCNNCFINCYVKFNYIFSLVVAQHCTTDPVLEITRASVLSVLGTWDSVASVRLQLRAAKGTLRLASCMGQTRPSTIHHLHQRGDNYTI